MKEQKVQTENLTSELVSRYDQEVRMNTGRTAPINQSITTRPELMAIMESCGNKVQGVEKEV